MLKQQIHEMDLTVWAAEGLRDEIQVLVNDGVLKQGADGHVIHVEDPAEREQIQIISGSNQRPNEEQPAGNRRQAQFFGPSQF